MFYKGLMLTTMLCSLFSIKTACAQSDMTQPEAGLQVASSEPDVIQEVIVTAEHRKRSLQKTAISMTTVGGNQIAEEGKSTLRDVLRDIPSVKLTGLDAGASIFVRGVGTNITALIGSPAVNLNIDGVYQLQSEIPLGLMYDVDRVEVLRGPQGTLYGRNSNAGAINILTRGPRLDKFEGGATLQLGNFDEVRTEAMINLPLGDKVAVRAAFASEQHDGYMQPSGDDDADSHASRVKLLYVPSADVSLELDYDKLHLGGEGRGTAAWPQADGKDAWYADAPAGLFNADGLMYRAQLDWNLGWSKLTFIPSYLTFDRYWAHIGPTDAFGSVAVFDTKQTTAEFRLASPDGSRVIWNAGLFYLNGGQGQTLPGENLINAPVNPQPNKRIWVVPTSYAAYFQVTVPFSDRLRLIAGGRYTLDKVEQDVTLKDTGDVTHGEKQWTSPTYKIQLETDLGAHSLLYAGVSSGFKAGGFGQDGAITPAFDPEEITAYEVGSKNRFLQNRLQINLSAFYYDYTGYQAEYPDLVAGGGFTNIVANAGNAKIKGAEIEGQWILHPQDRVTFAISYLDARFGTFKYTSFLTGTVDASGQQMPHAPKFSGSAGYEHDWTLSDGSSLALQLKARFSDAYPLSASTGLESEQSGYVTGDTYLVYHPAAGHWTLSTYVKNVTNKAIKNSDFFYTGATQAAVSLDPPRTYGLILSASF